MLPSCSDVDIQIHQELTWLISPFYPEVKVDLIRSYLLPAVGNAPPFYNMDFHIDFLGSQVPEDVDESLFDHVFNIIRRSSSQFRVVKIFRNVHQIHPGLIDCIHDVTDVRCSLRLQSQNGFRGFARLKASQPPNIRNLLDKSSLAGRPPHFHRCTLCPTQTYKTKFMNRFYVTLYPEMGRDDAIRKGNALWLHFAKAFFRDFFCPHFNLICDELTETEEDGDQLPENLPRKHQMSHIRMAWDVDPCVPSSESEDDDLVISPKSSISGKFLRHIVPLPMSRPRLAQRFNDCSPRSLVHLASLGGIDDCIKRVNRWLKEVRKQEEALRREGKSVQIRTKYLMIPVEAYGPFEFRLNCRGTHDMEGKVVLTDDLMITGRGRGRLVTRRQPQPMTVNEEIRERFRGDGGEFFKFSCRVTFRPPPERLQIKIDIEIAELLYDLNLPSKCSPPVRDLCSILEEEFDKYLLKEFDAWFRR